MVRRILVVALTPILLTVLHAQPPTGSDDEIDPDDIERLIRQLGSPDYRRREQAMVMLREFDGVALPFLKKQLNHPDLELRRRARELFAFLETSPPLRVFTGHEKGIIGLAVLPDSRQALTASEDHTIRRWDLATGKELERYGGHAKQVWCLAVAPDGRSFVSGGQDRSIRQWPIGDSSVKPRELATLPDSVRCLLFLPGGKHLLAGALDAKIYVIELPSGKIIETWAGQEDAVLCMALSADGTRVLSGGGFRDASICVRDAKTGAVLRRLRGHVEHVCAVAFVGADQAVSAGYDLKVRLWDWKSGKVLRTFVGPKRVIYGLDVSPDGRRLACGGYDKEIWLWDLATGDEVRRYRQHTDGINALAFTPDGRSLVSASNDRRMLLWTTPRRLKGTPPR